MNRRRIVTGVAGVAWLVAGVLAFASAEPRVFYLAAIVAATLTVPLLTTALVAEAAGKHVDSYLLALLDAESTRPDPDGDELPVVDETPERHLHAL